MRVKRKNIIFILTLIAIIFAVLIIWIVWSNKALELNQFTVKSNRLPEEFNGYRIAQISDLHNSETGKDNKKLISVLSEAKPDIIAITGDMIDSRRTDITVALQFAEKAMEIAPCYYVSGNHESRVSEYEDFKKSLIELGVVILADDIVSIETGGKTITLLGVDDPAFKTDYLFGDSDAVMTSKLQKMTKDNDDSYTVLLSHRPELFDVYVKSEIDLVLSGHAHGGQFRLPFIGGLAAPNQGLFPKYDAGIYSEENTNMIVSRGIGNSIIPFRVNNRPEVVLIELLSVRMRTV
ncbi:MAG: metallophosphoesterase [Clostridiales bacterium]|nr:metallophosphoesterase [Clostridiales bacterium]